MSLRRNRRLILHLSFQGQWYVDRLSEKLGCLRREASSLFRFALLLANYLFLTLRFLQLVQQAAYIIAVLY